MKTDNNNGLNNNNNNNKTTDSCLYESEFCVAIRRTT